jgi:hypothetical protein
VFLHVFACVCGVSSDGFGELPLKTLFTDLF